MIYRFHTYILLAVIIFTFSVPDKKVLSSLTDVEKQQLISAHNKWRAKVHVDSLKWSDELASEAQAWAEHLGKKDVV